HTNTLPALQVDNSDCRRNGAFVTGKHHGTDILVGIKSAHGLSQFVNYLVTKGIQGFGPVKCQDPYPPLHTYLHQWLSHCYSLQSKMVVMTNKFIVYSVTPYDPAGHRLRVTLQVPAPAPEGQELFMPAWIPGSYLIRDFARQVETIRASSRGQAVAIRKTGNHTWRCGPCAGPLDVEYTVYAWDLSVRSAHVD